MTRSGQYRASAWEGIDPYLLDAVCDTLDELDLLAADVRERGVTIVGARGHVVSNPAVAALARHRTLL